MERLKILTINFNEENAVPLLEQLCDKNRSIEKLTIINTTNSIMLITLIRQIKTISDLTLSQIGGITTTDIYHITLNSSIQNLTLHSLQIECIHALSKLCNGKIPQLKKLNLELLLNPIITDENFIYLNNKLKLIDQKIELTIIDQ